MGGAGVDRPPSLICPRASACLAGPTLTPVLIIRGELLGEEVVSDFFNLALLYRLTVRRFGLCAYSVELDEKWLRADVRLAKVLGVETQHHRHHQAAVATFVRNWQATARPRVNGSAISGSATLIAANVIVLSADPFGS
jgi:hypothetical protein